MRGRDGGRALAPLLLLLSACEEPRGGGAVDGGAARDAAPALDATAPDARPDAGLLRRDAAATVDAAAGSLAGTSLEGILIEWPGSLELCSAWREGRSAEEELLAKVHLSLPTHTRGSLESGELAGAALSGGKLRRGPLSGEQHDLAPVAGRLVRYQLNDPTGSASLGAEVEYDLGAAGLLSESFSVYRARGDRRPVPTDGVSYEHSFHYWPPEGGDPALLERCGGPPELEPAIAVLVGRDGPRSLTYLRFHRTRAAAAGSYPLVPQATLIRTDDDPAESYLTTTGFWAETYAAQHHNWEEESLLDFTRDLAAYATVLGPRPAAGRPLRATMPTRLRLAHVNSAGQSGELSLTTRTIATGAEETRRYTATAGWKRVDAAALLPLVRGRCPTAEVRTTADFRASMLLQLLVCPRSAEPGFELLAVVPMLYLRDPARAGEAIDGAAISPATRQGRQGFAVQLGAERLVITRAAGESYYFFALEGAGGVEIDTWLSEPFDPWLILRSPEELRFASAGDQVKAEVSRIWAAQGVGESAIYAPLRFALEFGGQRHLVEAWDLLDYQNTHHNWDDLLVGKAGGLTLRWDVSLESGPLSYRVQAVRDADGVEVLPWTDVEPR